MSTASILLSRCRALEFYRETCTLLLCMINYRRTYVQQRKIRFRMDLYNIKCSFAGKMLPAQPLGARASRDGIEGAREENVLRLSLCTAEQIKIIIYYYFVIICIISNNH